MRALVRLISFASFLGLDRTMGFQPAASFLRPTTTFPHTSPTATRESSWERPGPFLSPPFESTALEFRILYPDGMNTVPDPLWPRLDRLDDGDMSSPNMLSVREQQQQRHQSSPINVPSSPSSFPTPPLLRDPPAVDSPSRLLGPHGMETVPDSLWPDLAELESAEY